MILVIFDFFSILLESERQFTMRKGPTKKKLNKYFLCKIFTLFIGNYLINYCAIGIQIESL